MDFPSTIFSDEFMILQVKKVEPSMHLYCTSTPIHHMGKYFLSSFIAFARTFSHPQRHMSFSAKADHFSRPYRYANHQPLRTLCRLDQRFEFAHTDDDWNFRECVSSMVSGNLRASSSRLPLGWHSPRQQPPSPCLITGEILLPLYCVFLP